MTGTTVSLGTARICGLQTTIRGGPIRLTRRRATPCDPFHFPANTLPVWLGRTVPLACRLYLEPHLQTRSIRWPCRVYDSIACTLPSWTCLRRNPLGGSTWLRP